MKIYLDNCCFNRPFDDQKQIRIHLETEAKLYIQEKILGNELQLAWSYILDYENNANPFIERKSIISLWKQRSFTYINETPELIKEARQLSKRYIKSKDALHIASAVIAECNYFITTDNFLLKKMFNFKGIKIVNPVQFINQMEE